jgi:uncharacterized protein YggE
MKTKNLIFVLITIVLIVGSILYFINTKIEKTTINVSGQSTIEATADEVSVYVGIETLKDTAELSKNENSVISERVLKELAYIINKDDIETSSYNIYPEYNWNNGQQELKGYRTINVLKVKTKDFSKVGRIVDVSINNGANNVQSINFELSQEKQNEIKTQAISKASEDARIKAQATAQGLNAKLGKVKSVSVSDYNYNPYPYYMLGAAMDVEQAVSTEILPKDLEVRASVNVVFELT